MKNHVLFVNGTFALLTAIGMVGCMEEVDPPQTPQTQATPSSGTQQGPITSFGNQGGGSALGGAKRTATKMVGQAEQASRDVAGEEEPPTPDE